MTNEALYQQTLQRSPYFCFTVKERKKRDRERGVKRRAEHTGEYSFGSLFILWAKPVFLFFNTDKAGS